jgi:hypothetical protein
VSENRLLRRLLGPKREEVTGGWRKLYKEELHNLYCTRYFGDDEIKEDEMRQNKFIEAVTFVARIRKAFSLNIDWGTDSL